MLALLSILYFLPENTLMAEYHFGNCIHQSIFGFDCPGCGMTRATYLLLHLDIKKAILLNPCVLLLIPILLIEILNLIYTTILFKRIKNKTYSLFISTLFMNYLIKLFEHF